MGSTPITISWEAAALAFELLPCNDNMRTKLKGDALGSRLQQIVDQHVSKAFGASYRIDPDDSEIEIVDA